MTTETKRELEHLATILEGSMHAESNAAGSAIRKIIAIESATTAKAQLEELRYVAKGDAL